MNELAGEYNCRLYYKDYLRLWVCEIRSHASIKAFPDWGCLAKSFVDQKRNKERYSKDPAFKAKVLDSCKKYRISNFEKVKAAKQRWQQSLDPKIRRKYYDRWHSKNLVAIRERSNARRRTEKAKIKQRAWEKSRRESDPAFKLTKNLRRGIANICASQGTKKRSSILNLIGLSVDDFMAHIERQFTKKMTWKNYGKYWHIDHIIPCSSFDHSKQEQVAICWHWTNLRPLKASENLRKSDKMTEPQLMMRISA